MTHPILISTYRVRVVMRQQPQKHALYDLSSRHSGTEHVDDTLLLS